MTDRNNGSKTDGRNPDGTFATCNPGRPRGVRHRVTREVEELLDGEAEALTRKAIEKAMAGDMQALRLCLERVTPPRKDATVSFDLPAVNSVAEASEAASAVLAAVSNGELTPGEASSVMAILDQYRRVLEASDFEARITALEEKR